jgi:hypothetical protein
MSRAGELLARAGRDVRAAVAGAPVEVALAVLLAASVSISLRVVGFEPWFPRVLAGTLLAFPLVFALSVLAFRGAIGAPARWAATAGVLALSGWYAAARIERGAEGEWWRWVMLTVAAVLLLLLAAAVPWRERERRAVWAFGARLVASAVAIALYAAALYGLLAGAVASVVTLFELPRPDHLYADLAGVVFLALAPILLVGGIGRMVAPAGEGVPVLVAALGRWLWAPALVVYLAILYAYALKVAVTGELPSNLLSPLVIAAGLIGLLGAWMLEPVHASPEHRGLSLLARLVPALLIPLVPLALWGLGARLGAYGWTEFRYLRLAVVVAIAVLAVAGTVRLARRRPPLLAAVPLVLAAALLAAAMGPWSALAVSRRDQTARLRAAVGEAGLDPARVPFAEPVAVDSAVHQRISEGARYLTTVHGVDALRRVFPNAPDTLPPGAQMGGALGLRAECPETVGRVTAQLSWERAVPGVAGGAVRQVQLPVGAERSFEVAGGTLALRLDGESVHARGEGWTARGDLERIAGPHQARAAATCPGGEHPERSILRELSLEGEEALVPLLDGDGRLRAQLLVTTIAVGGPDPRDPEPRAPGILVREVQGLLVVPD